jgi:small GTP-binding protein
MVESYKVVILGDTNVGKTALLTRFAKGTFKKESEPTIGAHFMSKMITLPNTESEIKL